VIEKLKEVESGVASEYLNPVAQLEDNRQIRITVAGNLARQFGFPSVLVLFFLTESHN